MFKKRVRPAGSRNPFVVRDIIAHVECVACARLPLSVVRNRVWTKIKVRHNVVARILLDSQLKQIRLSPIEWVCKGHVDRPLALVSYGMNKYLHNKLVATLFPGNHDVGANRKLEFRSATEIMTVCEYERCAGRVVVKRPISAALVGQDYSSCWTNVASDFNLEI